MKCIFTAATVIRGNFLQCIRTRQRTICNVEVAAPGRQRDVARRRGQAIETTLASWDPVAERFIGDEEANRLLSIAKRPPWHT